MLLTSFGPAFAARPLLDHGQWDAYFALFARDVYVPWKPSTIRLDTYSGAPVEFAAYNVDPAEVIVAGQNRTPRAIDTAHRKPVVRWRFSPPPGYRFVSSDVELPLGSQEGFYVVEARRGDAVQQVWVNRTHVGLVTKESPDGLVVWGVNLRSGHPIAGMTVSFLVGLNLVSKHTDGDGLIFWRDRPRPTFALAEHDAGRAFVSLLPQAPLPASIVGLRLESAVVRAGATVRFVGFARKRTPQGYRREPGDARVTFVGNGATLSSTSVHLDQAGAFEGEIAVPAGLEAGDYAILAAAAGGVGGTTVSVDAAGDVALAIRPGCPCDPDRDVPFAVLSRRDDLPVPGVTVRVRVIRTPHVVPPGAPEDAVRWGTTVVFDRTLHTDADGHVHIDIPPPSDGLDSTYGIRATARGASATSRIVVPNARLSLAVEPAAAGIDVGAPAAVDVRGFDPADGTPAAGLPVTVRLSHGASVQQQGAVLDAHGAAHVVFERANLGSNLALAESTVDGRRALDVAAIVVEPSALSGRTVSSQDAVTVSTDKSRYRPGDPITVRADAAGSAGHALITLDGARTYQARLVPVAHGEAQAELSVGDPLGAFDAWAAFVRDGAIATGSTNIAIDGPGRERLTEIALDKPTYAPADILHATIRDGGLAGPATIAMRIADGRESGPALFDDAPDVLRIGATSFQAPASDDPEWHAYVAPARSKASDIFAAERPRKVETEITSIGVAAPRTMLWRVERSSADGIDVPVPSERGHFVLSILKISDDGDVGAASVSFNVQ